MPSIWPFGAAATTASTAVEESTGQADGGKDDFAASAALIPPLIICEGFLSAAQSVVWGNEFRTYLGVGHQQLVDQTHPHRSSTRKRRSGLGSARPVVFAPIGPVSSLHDRACELFYALRGGTVDYGVEHARQHRHSRFGRHYAQPLCPTWGPSSSTSPGLPAHFLGHSLGGPTILKLQQLLRQGFFDEALGISRADKDAAKAEDWILSVTSVSSPFRGTPIVYSLGSEPLPYPKVRMFSFGDMLSKFIHIAAWLDLPFDVHADAWHFSARRRKAIRRLTANNNPAETHIAESQCAGFGSKMQPTEQDEASGLRDFLKQLWKSDWAGGRDCAPWDCTFAERDQDRAEEGWGLELGAARRGRTWYRSYAGGMTVPEPEAEAAYHRPQTYWSLSPLTFTAHLIGHFDYSRLQPRPSFLARGEKDEADAKQLMARLSAAWWQNDGVVPLASQFHPLDCDPARCRHFKGMPASLPFGTRQKRPQSTELALEAVDGLLPVPATQPRATQGSMLASATAVARIAYSTSLRALTDDPPLLTPSDEELRSFIPEFPPNPTTTRVAATTSASHHTDAADVADATATTGAREMEKDLVDPEPNRWYTFEIDGLDHTSLCPFWTGSEVQKQFWTGMGFFLASVDRQTNYPTHPSHTIA